MTQSVVIHGPAGCGKSVNAHRLRRKFGLKHVLDDATRWNKPIPDDTLVLTNVVPPAHVHDQARVLSFAEAMRVAGFSRSPA